MPDLTRAEVEAALRASSLLRPPNSKASRDERIARALLEAWDRIEADERADAAARKDIGVRLRLQDESDSPSCLADFENAIVEARAEIAKLDALIAHGDCVISELLVYIDRNCRRPIGVKMEAMVAEWIDRRNGPVLRHLERLNPTPSFPEKDTV